MSASSYVERLRTDVMRQAPPDRGSTLYSKLNALSYRVSKDGKPALVDIGRFLTVQVGSASGGWLRKEDIISNIVEKLIPELPDTSAASSTLAMGLVVAFRFFSFDFFNVCWSDICVYWNGMTYVFK